MGKQANYSILCITIYNFDNYHQAAGGATDSEENTEYENGPQQYHYYYYICAVLSRSVVSDSLRPPGAPPGAQQCTRLLCPWGFSRQEYGSGLPCPPPGDLPNPGIEPRAPALQADSFLSLSGCAGGILK